MTFSTTPRSRSPVFSIYTQSHKEDMLRAEIEAASTQQQKYKRDKTRHAVEPTIEEESDVDEVEYDDSTHSEYAQDYRARRSGRRRLSSSFQGITGTVRSEFSIAKQFLKMTSRRQFNRIRPKSNTVTPPAHGQRPELQDIGVGMSDGQPAELSSDPLCQLDDNPRISMQSDDDRANLTTPPVFQQIMSPESLSGDVNDTKTSDLCHKSYSCDNCQHPIRGGDHYDFCALCSPSDRVLCITCARQGRCRRHRTERYSLDEMSLSRASPAPPYTRPPQIESLTGQNPVLTERSRSSGDPGSQIKPFCDEPGSNTGLDRSDTVMSESVRLMQMLQRMIDQQTPPSTTPQERTIQDKEASLREQLAAVREERMAVKEQELLVREREQLSRERDAMVIHNLQALVTIQELSRNGFIGAQFPSFKKGGDKRPHNNQEPVRRAESCPEDDNISLEDLGNDHKPKVMVAEVVAQAEATINDLTVDDKHVRSHPGQKRKKGNSAAATSSTTLPTLSVSALPSKSDSQRQQLSEEDDDDSDDGSINPKKRRQDPIDPDSPQRIFACPYFKHDRARYSPRNLAEKHYRGCAGHFLHDIPRLKQHLRRVHWRPEHHCPRCFEVFSKPAQLDQHHERVQGCSKKVCPFPEKMDKQQRQLIHVKRPKVLPEPLWYDIYRALFPGSPLPESPYAEEEETTPPSSAAPSSASPEEATHRMVQIFNERLDRHQGEPEYAWLSSLELRRLLDSEIVESMSELLSNISSEPIIPQDPGISHTPSIIVSPVTPPPATDMKPPHKQQISFGGSAHSRRGKNSSRAHKSAPILKQPKPLLSPALRSPGSMPVAEHSHNVRVQYSGDGMQNFVKAWPGWTEPPSISPQASISTAATQSPLPSDGILVNFPYTAPVDEGYDDQSGSFRRGDDREAMETMIPAPSRLKQATAHLQAPRPVRPRHDQRFVPVRLETLEDSGVADLHPASQQLQTNKSVASLVDSGYGTGNSEHRRSPSDSNNDDDMDMFDAVSPVGYTSFFEEELQRLESSGDHHNPWQSADDMEFLT